MNTNTLRTQIDWPVSASIPMARHLLEKASFTRARRFGFLVLLAALPLVVMVVGAAWAVGMFANPYILQAVIWAAGFVFLALAVESRKPSVIALLATGLALPVLAILSARVAPEFAVLAAALVAEWIAAAILRRHRAGNS